MISAWSIGLIAVGGLGFSMLYVISVQPAALSLRMGERAYRLCGLLRSIAMLFELAVLVGYALFPFGHFLNLPISAGHSVSVRIGGAVFALITLGFMTVGLVAAGGEAASPRKETGLYGGIYKYMRHPQTLGEMLSWLGFAMILNSLALLVFSVVWIPLFIGYTVVEDNDLAVRFGGEYLEYATKVGVFWRKRGRSGARD